MVPLGTKWGHQTKGSLKPHEGFKCTEGFKEGSELDLHNGGRRSLFISQKADINFCPVGHYCMRFIRAMIRTLYSALYGCQIKGSLKPPPPPPRGLNVPRCLRGALNWTYGKRSWPLKRQTLDFCPVGHYCMRFIRAMIRWNLTAAFSPSGRLLSH